MARNDYDATVKRVRHALADEVTDIGCPVCSGPLKVQVSDSSKRALSVMCKGCVWRVIEDGLDEFPPWVEELGRKIETKENYSPQN